MTQNNTNPKINEVDKEFIDDDLLSEFMQVDQKYTSTRKSSYLEYKKNYNQLFPNNSTENLFMSVKNSYLNIVHLITKNAVVATMVMLIALTTVSASAAELLAPTEYKPSTIASNFLANKQVEKDPYTALKPDENNNVAISDKCDLAIKYPKQLESKKIVTVSKKEENDITTSKKIQDFIYIMDEVTALEQRQIVTVDTPIKTVEEQNKLAGARLLSPSIMCQDKDIEPTFIKEIFSPEVFNPNVVTPGQTQEYTELDAKNKIVELTSWLVTEANIENLHLYESKNQLTKLTVSDWDNLREQAYYYTTDAYKLVFNLQNKYYTIKFELPSKTVQNLPPTESVFVDKLNKNVEVTNTLLNLNGVFGNDFQLQFNSLVKNEANVEILQKPESVVNKPVQNTIKTPVVSKPEEKVVTKTLTLAGEADGYTILQENQMTAGEGNKFIAFYYTKSRTEFTNRKSTEGAVAEFKITAKIKSNPKTFELFDKVKVELELVDVQKVEQINAATSGVQTYTNQYYPDLKINYGDDWKMETKSTPSRYKNLVNREIIFTKNQTKLSFYLDISTPIGCSGEGEEMENHIVKAGEKRYRFVSQSKPNKYHYKSDPEAIASCFLYYSLNSNLNIQDFPEYADLMINEKVIKSIVTVNLQGSNPQELIEADQIVANSKFWSD